MSSRGVRDDATGRLISRLIVLNRAPSEQGGGGPGAHAAEAAAWALPGICGAVRLSTSFGHVPTHLIRKGDPVLVEGNSYLPVRAVREYRFEADFIAERPEARPVVLAGTSPDGGTATTHVSPGQFVLTRERETGETRRLVAARDLGPVARELPPIPDPFTYFRFFFDRHVLLWAEGFWLDCPPLESA